MNRAYSLLTVKAVDEDARVITGMATTPTPDRLQDIVEPDGAQFKLPMPLLFHHDSEQPIGHVIKAKVSKTGIEIVAKLAKLAEPGRLKDRLDEAWQTLKIGLVSGLSIGFKPIELSFIEETNGIRFIKWDWLETSAVTIPANSEATIATVKSIDAAQRAASGQQVLHRVVHLTPPGASGQSQRKLPAQEGADMKTIAEQITALEAKRQASAARMEAVMQKTLDEDRTSDTAEQEEFDNLSAEVEAIDKDLVRLRKIEQAKAQAAKTVKANNAAEGAAARNGGIIVKTQPALPPGIEAARIWKCRMNSALSITRGEFLSPAEFAARMYGPDSNVVGVLTKANVPAGATVAGNWAANLIGAETGALADFVAYLRPMTILGRFGVGGIPGLRQVPFRTPLITETGGGAAWWVGEGKAKPLTSFSYTRTTLTPLKVATICALTEECIRDSSPKADTIVRDSLVAALRERLDLDFITPTKAAVAGVSPASITNGAPTIVSSGDDADAIRLDVRSLLAKFTAANNPPSAGVFIMGSSNAAALAMMVNPLGQPEFPTMSPTGGSLFGMPVIASDYVGAAIVVLVNASDIYEADDGEVAVDMSREASLEMTDAPTGSSITPTATSLVSLWQTNTVGIRAERTINWMRRRTPSVAYLTSADWGGPVHTA
jgi:HK97 family phage prohead protease